MINRFLTQLKSGCSGIASVSGFLVLSILNAASHAEITTGGAPVAAPTAAPVNILMLQRYSDALDKIERQNDSVWNRIGEEHWLSFQEDHPRIVAQRKRYLDHKHYVTTVSKRAEPFLHYIVRKLYDNGTPLELALLPFVESAFHVDAVSKHGATGLWQFNSVTAKEKGLHRNWWYEGRRDLLASTDAAIGYLSELNQSFKGNWLYTLAAYNAGASTVKKAIEANRRAGKPTDFWSLQLPKETMDYVPRFLAVITLVRSPDAYGIELWPVENEAYFTEISVEGKTSLKEIASQQLVSLKTLKQLNSGLLRGITPPTGFYTILLPLKTIETVQAASSKTTFADPSQTHQVQTGDTLSHISRLYGVTVAALKVTNQLSTDQIRAGQQLLIPEY